MDLELGRIDALTLGLPTASLYAQERGIFEIIAQTEDNFMIGAFFRKGDPLRDEFNAALNVMKKDRTVARLYEQYFGYEPPAGSAPVKVFTEPYIPKKQQQLPGNTARTDSTARLYIMDGRLR